MLSSALQRSVSLSTYSKPSNLSHSYRSAQTKYRRRHSRHHFRSHGKSLAKFSEGVGVFSRDMSGSPAGFMSFQSNPKKSHRVRPRRRFRHSLFGSLKPRKQVDLFTLTEFPSQSIVHFGGLVMARSVKLMSDIKKSSSPQDLQDAWWNELREEIRSHCRSLTCTHVIGYRETNSIYGEICVLTATGTACVIDEDRACHANRHTRKNCCWVAHVPFRKSAQPYPMQLSRCAVCSQKYVPEVLLSTSEIPPSFPLKGSGCFVEARVCRKLLHTTGESRAIEVSESLPFLEFDLHRQLMNKMKLQGTNAIFGLQMNLAFGNDYIIAVASGTSVFFRALPPPQAIEIEIMNNRKFGLENMRRHGGEHLNSKSQHIHLRHQDQSGMDYVHHTILQDVVEHVENTSLLHKRIWEEMPSLGGPRSLINNSDSSTTTSSSSSDSSAETGSESSSSSSESDGARIERNDPDHRPCFVLELDDDMDVEALICLLDVKRPFCPSSTTPWSYFSSHDQNIFLGGGSISHQSGSLQHSSAPYSASRKTSSTCFLSTTEQYPGSWGLYPIPFRHQLVAAVREYTLSKSSLRPNHTLAIHFSDLYDFLRFKGLLLFHLSSISGVRINFSCPREDVLRITAVGLLSELNAAVFEEMFLSAQPSKEEIFKFETGNEHASVHVQENPSSNEDSDAELSPSLLDSHHAAREQNFPSTLSARDLAMDNPSTVESTQSSRPHSKSQPISILRGTSSGPASAGVSSSLEENEATTLSHSSSRFPVLRTNSVQLSPTGYLPGCLIGRNYGRLGIQLVRETFSLREMGGISSFTNRFLLEAQAVLKAHVHSIGGNGLLNLRIEELVVDDRTHKNKAYALLSLSGDAVELLMPGKNDPDEYPLPSYVI